jgi:Ca-activated chloride channel family protein
VGFAAPLWLLALALVPLALAAYVAAQRRRRRYAVRYPNVDLLAAVAGRSWDRHVPAALALLALAALAVALARPQRTVAAEQRQGTVVMVTDTSGSMMATDVRPNRLSAARGAAKALADALPRGIRLGLVSFSSTAEQLVAPSTDKTEALLALGRLQVRGATAMGDGLSLALDAARTPVPGTDAADRSGRPPAAIVLLSDGASTRGADPLGVAARAKRAGVRVYTVALGTPQGTLDRAGRRVPVPPDPSTLQRIAQVTGGRFYSAADAGRLEEIYAGLGERFATRRERQEVTAAFAGGALALLLAGGALGLARAGRLP